MSENNKESLEQQIMAVNIELAHARVKNKELVDNKIEPPGGCSIIAMILFCFFLFTIPAIGWLLGILYIIVGVSFWGGYFVQRKKKLKESHDKVNSLELKRNELKSQEIRAHITTTKKHTPNVNIADEIYKLVKLKEQGILSDEEFIKAKRNVLQ